jgi:hypothetical protein
LNTLIVNCGEFTNLLIAIEEMVAESKWKVNKIIDYDEYKHKYAKFSAEFVSFYDHIRLKHTLYSKNEYYYVSKELIIFAKEYLNSALDILKIRHVKNGVNFNEQESLKLFYDSLNRSVSEIKDKKIEFIVFNHVPHHFNTYLLYVAAKFLGIKTLIVTKLSWNGFRYYLDTSIGERGWSVKKLIQCCDQTQLEDCTHYDEIRNRSSYSKPVYMVRKYNRQLVSLLAKYFDKNIFFYIGIAIIGAFEIGFFKKMPCHFKWNNDASFLNETYPMKIFQTFSQIYSMFRIKKISKIYESLSSNIELKKKCYVLFAPNYQPEATTLPTSMYFYDIYLCVKLLRSRLPDKILIIYKEHEDIFNLNLEGDRCRSRIFYENLLNIKNVMLADRNTSQIELIDNSKFVVIQTSNIGLDSLIRGKPVMNFGPTWYDDFSGILDWNKFDVPNGYQVMISTKVEDNIKNIVNINKYTVRLDSNEDSMQSIIKIKILFRQALKILQSH